MYVNSPIPHYPFTLLYHPYSTILLRFWRVVACPEEVQLTTFSCLIFIPQWLGGKLAAAEFSPTLSCGYPASRPSPLSITLPLATVTQAGTITSGDNNSATLLLSLSLPLILNKGGRVGKLVCQKPPCLLHLWLRVMVTLHLWSAIYRPPIAGVHLVAGLRITGAPMRLPAYLPASTMPPGHQYTHDLMFLLIHYSPYLLPPLNCSHFQPLPH